MQKVSVIVPVYNVASYLGCCIESVLRQTFIDFELIMVDDGSTDTSGRICDYYASLDMRCRVIHKTNGGLSDARNAGLDVCNGEYITFIDSDDWVEPKYLEFLVKGMEENVDFVKCNIYHRFEKKEDDFCQYSSLDEQVLSKYEALESFICGDWTGVTCVAWGKLFRRQIWEKMRFPKGRIHEDIYAIGEIIINLQLGRVKLINVPLYNYFHRSTGLSQQKTIKEKKDLLLGWCSVSSLMKKEYSTTKAFQKCQSIILHSIVSIIKDERIEPILKGDWINLIDALTVAAKQISLTHLVKSGYGMGFALKIYLCRFKFFLQILHRYKTAKISRV